MKTKFIKILNLINYDQIISVISKLINIEYLSQVYIIVTKPNSYL